MATQTGQLVPLAVTVYMNRGRHTPFLPSAVILGIHVDKLKGEIKWMTIRNRGE